MASTKVRTSLWSAQTLTAGGANISTTWVDLSTSYGAQINIRLTNGATGPTAAAQVQIVAANDYNSGAPHLPCQLGGAFVGGTAASEVDYLSADIPLGVAAVQLVAGSNTGEAVTVDADISVVAAVS